MLAILSKVPKSLWVVLITLTLLSASNYYTFNKGFDMGVMEEKEKNRTAADAALIRDLEKTKKELEAAVAVQKDAINRVNTLRDDLSSSHTQVQELEEQLKDAKNTIDPNCNKLSPERDRMYQSIYSKVPTSGKNRSDKGTDKRD